MHNKNIRIINHWPLSAARLPTVVDETGRPFCKSSLLLIVSYFKLKYVTSAARDRYGLLVKFLIPLYERGVLLQKYGLTH